MTRTKKFSELADKISNDPVRAARADRARAEALAEVVEYSLNEIRRARGLTQVEIARVLETPQSGVSRLEQGGDVLLSTLRRYVEAMGGRLEVVAVFGDQDDRLPIRVA